MLEPMLAVDDAERRGDVAGALEIIGAYPVAPDGRDFWRPWRVRRLVQLFMLKEVCPGWVTSRWLLAQATETLGPAARVAAAKALETAVELRGGEDALPGLDEVDALCKVLDGDWVFRQLFLYEYGGLATFLRGAPADLLAGADRIRDWCGSPMGVYRLETRGSAEVTWRCLTTDEIFAVPNTGSGALVVVGEAVLARRVPIARGSMFESSPLVVPEAVAEAVARDPSAWLAVLQSAGIDGILVSGNHFEMITDVPHAVWTVELLRAEGGPVILDPAETGPRLARAFLAMASRVLHGPEADPLDIDPWACLAAALCHPGVVDALFDVTTVADRPTFDVLAERLAEPAATIARDLASGLRRAA